MTGYVVQRVETFCKGQFSITYLGDQCKGVYSRMYDLADADVFLDEVGANQAWEKNDDPEMPNVTYYVCEVRLNPTFVS